MNKRNLFILGLALALLFFVFAFNASFASSAFSVASGNSSNGINTKYAPGASISGWINMSITDESSDALFRVGTKSVTLKQVLTKNAFVSGQDYNCSTAECNLTYAVQGTSGLSKTFSLSTGEQRIVGLKITESSDLDSIDGLLLNISSTANASCSEQLKIDLFDDGIYDWVADKKANTFCGQTSSCFSNTNTNTQISSTKTYCEDIFVEPAPGLRVSANVSTALDSNKGTFSFSIQGTEQTCSKNITGSGLVFCDMNMSIIESKNITVCLMQDFGNSYNIYYEDIAPVCGYVGSASHDFSIFAQRLKYDSIGNIIFNSSELLGADILNYIESNYDDCTSGCFIPIRFYSGMDNQQITLNKASLSYDVAEITKTQNDIYFLDKTPSKISMRMKALNLNDLGFNVPMTAGRSNFTLYFKEQVILSKNIEVLGIPIINSVYPLEVPAGVKTKFAVSASGRNITGYSWDFGDNTTLETTSGLVSHKYSTMGAYTLTVKAKNSEGESTKIVTVAVISPELALNSTIANFDKQLSTLNSQIANFPASVKDYIKKKLKFSDAETKIQQAKTKLEYSGGSDNLSAIDILNSLSDLNLPDAIVLSDSSSGKFIMDKGKVSQSDLSTFTGETSDSSDDSFKTAVYAWAFSNLDVTSNVKSYSVAYDETLSPLATYVSIKLTPKKTVGEVYVVINKPKNSLEFAAGTMVKETTTSSAAVVDLSGGEKTLEFISGDKLTIIDLPVYFSPLLSKLQTGFEISPCNSNKKCEKDLGETWKNCKIDCKPTGLTIFWLFILIIVFFVAYIFAQEWYKKKYEGYLFKDKNDLFNLIHFIDNAEKQGLKREAFIEKLKEKKWDSEQITYAYKKFKGERTGMWEIPVMKFFENKKLLEQLNLRKRLGMNANTVPTPVRPFIRPMAPGMDNMPAKPAFLFGSSPAMPPMPPKPVQNPVQSKPSEKPEEKKPEADKK